MRKKLRLKIQNLSDCPSLKGALSATHPGAAVLRFAFGVPMAAVHGAMVRRNSPQSKCKLMFRQKLNGASRGVPAEGVVANLRKARG